MASKVADFFADIKIQGDTLTLKTMVDSMAEMKLETLGEIGALGVLGLALKNAGAEAMRLSTGYTAINKEYGTNITMLQRWQNVARGSNVPVEAVAQTFASMQKMLASPFIGNPNSAFMRAAGLLGIRDANRMTAEQLNEVLRVAVPGYIRRMTPVQGRENAITNAGSLIEALGASRSMMQLYTLPERQFRRQEMNAPILNSSDVRRWTELSEQVQVISHRLFMLGEGILMEALPELLKWTNALIESEGWIKRRFGKAEETAAMPWKQTPGNPVWEHALASMLIPDFVRKESAKSVTIEQHNQVDIHAHGSDPSQVAGHSKREFDRKSQDHLTQAAQLINTQQAW